MTYTVTVEQEAPRLHRVRVKVFDDQGTLVLPGETHVATDDPQVAYEYGEQIFLSDLRVCFPWELAGLVFPWEQEAEQDGEGA